MTLQKFKKIAKKASLLYLYHGAGKRDRRFLLLPNDSVQQT
jgi:hypothetical protein